MRRVGRGLCECSQSWRPRHQLGQPQLDARRRKGAGEGQGGRTPQGSGDPYQQKPRLLTGGGGLERKVHVVASSALWCPGQRAAGTSPAQTPARPTQTPARGPQPPGRRRPLPQSSGQIREDRALARGWGRGWRDSPPPSTATQPFLSLPPPQERKAEGEKTCFYK